MLSKIDCLVIFDTANCLSPVTPSGRYVEKLKSRSASEFIWYYLDQRLFPRGQPGDAWRHFWLSLLGKGLLLSI